MFSLRNFVFTDFHGTASDFDLLFWNNTPLDLSKHNYNQIDIPNSRLHPITNILKRTRQDIELNINGALKKDTTYQHYKVLYQNFGIKSKIKNMAVKMLTRAFSGSTGIEKIRGFIKINERKTSFYKIAREQLVLHRPAMVFCTSQRDANAIVPVLAARDLNIPTATFIYSWDNMPKATMLVEADYYFVWSDHMKDELLHYYPFVKPEQIYVTGTPQFEMHLDRSGLMTRQDFCEKYNLDGRARFICFSGDDATTSPNDSYYLEDTAIAVRKMRDAGQHLAIIFRRCPTDFSNRFDRVLNEYSDVIFPIEPAWMRDERNGKPFPTVEDTMLLLDTINNSEFVINLGSSMVFDFALFNKPTAYICYDVVGKPVVNPDWTVKKIYKFVHFRSMPSKNVVTWINSADELQQKFTELLKGENNTAPEALEWFRIINQNPPDLASERIVEACRQIIGKADKIN